MKGLGEFDWEQIASELDLQGAVVLEAFCDAAECDELGSAGSHSPARPAARALERGVAELYSRLLPVARRWARDAGREWSFPESLAEFRCVKQVGSRELTASIELLREGERMALQTDEKPHFPLQGSLLLSEPSVDFAGGELTMTERRPRMQSRPMVVPMRHKGDLVTFVAGERPFKGSNGFYRVYMKHGVARVSQGQRASLDLKF